MTAACLVMAGSPAFAEELEITGAQIRNLGIEFAPPVPAPGHATIEATATVVVPPGKEAFASAMESGLLAGLHVSVGEKVVRGQSLAVLQSPGFLALQREFLDALNENLLADSELIRDRQLFHEGIIAGRRLQETTTRAKIAAASVNEHRQLLQIAGLSDREIRVLETNQTLHPELVIRAPFDGVVIERFAVAGERLDTMSPVYRIADLSTLWLEIDVPQERLAGVRPGMKVSVAGSPVEFAGNVTTIGHSVDPGTQAVTVRAALIEEGHGLGPGQFVSARILSNYVGAGSTPVWRIPAAAVTRSGENHFIFVRVSRGIGVRAVSIVGSDSKSAFVSANLDATDEIAIEGITAIKALWSTQSEPNS